jgi:peptide-methionine (R)-S-oxide reductase
MQVCHTVACTNFTMSAHVGIYVCSKCGHELFSSTKKYAHSSPWPSFTSTVHSDSVVKHREGFNAYKVRCGKCHNGLGHEFLNDGPSAGASRF